MTRNEQMTVGRAVVAGVTGMVAVGTSVGVSRVLVDAPLFTAQAVRYALAAVLLVVVCRIAGGRPVRPRGREWLWLAGVAGSGLVLFNVAVVRGVAHAEPAVIAVAVACAPVFLGVLGPLMSRHRPAAPVVAAAVVVTAGGVLVEGAGTTDPIGVLWAVVALACECGFTLLALPVLGRHGAHGVSLHSVWMGAAMLGVLGLTVEGPGSVRVLTAAQWAAVAWLAVVVTAAAFVLWYSAVHRIGPGRAGLITGVAPVSAALSGALLGSAWPGPGVWLGISVVIGGLAAGLLTSRRSPGSPIKPAPGPGFADQPEPRVTLTPELHAPSGGCADDIHASSQRRLPTWISSSPSVPGHPAHGFSLRRRPLRGRHAVQTRAGAVDLPESARN